MLKQVSLLLLLLLLVHVSVLVRCHLTQSHDCVLTVQTVVVRLLAGMDALALCAALGRGELLEASGHDGVKLLMLASVRDYLVGVRADKVALETVEVRRFVLSGACREKF